MGFDNEPRTSYLGGNTRSRKAQAYLTRTEGKGPKPPEKRIEVGGQYSGRRREETDID